MQRSSFPAIAPTGLLDREAPIVKEFEDGAKVSAWMNIVRNDDTPTVDLLRQLKANGWEHVTVLKVEEILDARRRQPIGYGKVSGILSRNMGCELEVEITDTNGRKFCVALCRNEFTLLHGHTIVRGGPEVRTLLKMATTTGNFGGLLMATAR